MGSAMAQTGLDFPKPKGLLPGGQSDSRFPVSFAAPVTEGLRLVIEYFTALNQRDVAGIAKTLHFPFAIYRSEEHTSELQSLMRISYAVFCLKKKNHNTPITH